MQLILHLLIEILLLYDKGIMSLNPYFSDLFISFERSVAEFVHKAEGGLLIARLINQGLASPGQS